MKTVIIVGTLYFGLCLGLIVGYTTGKSGCHEFDAYFDGFDAGMNMAVKMNQARDDNITYRVFFDETGYPHFINGWVAWQGKDQWLDEPQ